MLRYPLLALVAATMAACNQPLQPRGDATALASRVETASASYEVADLGSFHAVRINDRGMVVGYAFIGNDVHGVLWDHGTTQDLGMLGNEPPGSAVFPLDMNERGQIVGYNSYGFNHVRGFLWDCGVMQDLGDLQGNRNDLPSVIANAISQSGQVVGESDASPSGRHAFLWEDGAMTDLGTLGGFRSAAFGVNNRGQVVGWSLTSSRAQHAFLWDAGAMQDLGTIGGDASIALLINEPGQVAGTGTTAAGETHAFFWSGGIIQDIGAFTPVAIGNDGSVAGNDGGQAFVWARGELTPLGSLGGDWTVVSGMNNRGQVVGTSMTAAGEAHAFVWDDGVMSDLGALADAAASSAVAISNNGAITGLMRGTSGETRALLWRKGSQPAETVVASR